MAKERYSSPLATKFLKATFFFLAYSLQRKQRDKVSRTCRKGRVGGRMERSWKRRKVGEGLERQVGGESDMRGGLPYLYSACRANAISLTSTGTWFPWSPRY